MSTMVEVSAMAKVNLIRPAGERVANAVRLVQELEDGRAMVKAAAVKRIMATENPETSKPHSATSAEKIVESDADYAAYRVAQADAEVEKIRAFAEYESAKLTAKLYVVTAGAE